MHEEVVPQIVSSAGYHGDGRLGRKGTVNQLTRIQYPLPPLLMCSCGWKHTIFLAIDGSVFVCGDNRDGQLGPGVDNGSMPVRSEALSSLDVKWCACGERMTALLTGSGDVLACGIGWGADPVPLVKPEKAVFVSCGVSMICGIGISGRLFMWSNKSTKATVLSSDEVFCDCAAGSFHIFGLSSGGVLYVAGRSKACGQGRKWCSNDLVPVESLVGIPIRRVFAAYGHSVAVDTCGRVYVCGWNSFGELGIGDERKTSTFKRVPTFDDHAVMSAALGYNFTAFVTEKFELFTCGSGDDFRLCNATTTSTNRPVPADATGGRRVSWVSCGDSHIVVVENMAEISEHPCDNIFESKMRIERRKRQLPASIETISIAKDSGTMRVLMDISDYGTTSTGFFPGDTVEDGESGEAEVVGVTEAGVAINEDGELCLWLLDGGDSGTMPPQMKITKRPGAELREVTARSGLRVTLDVSNSTCHAFGFAPGDVVEHLLLGKASVAGVFAGCLWYEFADDEGTVVTSLSNSLDYIHKHLKIVEPNDRSIKYMEIDDMNWPIETAPCSLLNVFALQVGDLVETIDGVGVVIGCFRHQALIQDVVTKIMSLYLPNSLLLLRRIGDPVLVERATLKGGSVAVDVSCRATDKFMPFDRVVTHRGIATLVGRANGKMWCHTDEALAIGVGIGMISDTDFRLVRRLAVAGKHDDLSVSSSDFEGVGVLPGDIVEIRGVRQTILGRTSNQEISAQRLDAASPMTISRDDLSSCSLTFRADLPATRHYNAKDGRSHLLSVSLRNFQGVRFIPGDVLATPYGPCLVIGASGSLIAVHLLADAGFTYFPSHMVRDLTRFQLKQRTTSIL